MVRRNKQQHDSDKQINIAELLHQAESKGIDVPADIKRGPFLASYLRAMMNEDALTFHAQETAKKIHEMISNEPVQEWLPCAPMPTELCRLSPFFPMSKNELSKERDRIKDMVITKGPWGELKFSGDRLSVYEEDILMAILALVDSAEHRDIVEDGDKKYLRFEGTKRAVLKYAGYSSKGNTNYRFLDKALNLLDTARFEIFTKADSTARKVGIFKLVERTSKSFSVTLNEYFYEVFAKKAYTLIDVQRRAQLKSPIAKAMLRFVQSHRDAEWKGHYITLAQVLNLNLELPARKIRSRIKEAILDLIKNKVLTDKSCLLKNDIVLLFRHPSMAVRRKELVNRQLSSKRP